MIPALAAVVKSLKNAAYIKTTIGMRNRFRKFSDSGVKVKC